jgi:rhodanese-related sulfurtransferase
MSNRDIVWQMCFFHKLNIKGGGGMKKNILGLLMLGVMLSVLILPAWASLDEAAFPLRAKYPEQPYVSTPDLLARYNEFIIVDVRSKFEYDVIHINKASNILVTKASFLGELEAIRAKDGATPIAFYCNGHSCAKSYKATKKAMEAGFKNVFVYDDGIFNWAIADPDKTTLLGQTPMDPAKIIPKSEFKNYLVNIEEIQAKAQDPNVVVIDIRDPFQREFIPKIYQLRNIPLDRILPLLKKGEFKENKIYFIDATGKQIAWLQYHLKANGYIDYRFLEKGVKSIK